MKYLYPKGATDVSVYVFIQDATATDGSGLTGLVHNSAGLVASQVRPGAARAAITLASQTVTGSHTDGGFVEVDATNMPGVYRLDLPDAVLASGVDSVVFMLLGAADMVPCVGEIQLSGINVNDATGGGITRLDATVSSRAASSSLPAGFSTLLITTGVVHSRIVEVGVDPVSSVGDVKADVSALALASSLPANFSTVSVANNALAANVTRVAGSAVSGVADFRADVSALALASSLPANFSTVTIANNAVASNVTRVAGSAVSGVADFRADVSALATAANLTIVDGIVDDIKAVTVKLDTALEPDGSGGWQYTTLAVENVASGSGLTAQQTRDAMKLAASAGSPAAGSIDTLLTSIDTVADKLDDTLENNLGTWRFTGPGLSQAPTGGSLGVVEAGRQAVNINVCRTEP